MSRPRQIVTVWDAGAERRREHARWEQQDERERQARAVIAATLAAHPEIGMLMRAGRPVYYVASPVYAESRDPRALLEVTP